MPELALIVNQPAGETRLAELEGIIAAGRQSFYEVGCALREIRDARLYKLKNGGQFKTFEEYCKTVWRWRRDYTNKQIRAADTVEVLDTMVSKDEVSERLVRPLTKLEEPAAQVACFQKARELAEVEGQAVTARHVKLAVDRLLENADAATKFCRLIKPSDNWNFSPVEYGRIDDGTARHGYVPGETYANILWYWSRDGDVIVAPMAGAGQIFRVYDDRERWMRPEPWRLSIEAFDLTPRGPYKDRIQPNDALTGIPAHRPDLIIADLPYFGMCEGIYSDDDGDLGNMDWEGYWPAVGRFAANCAAIQERDQKAVVITAARFVEHKTASVRLLDDTMADAFRAVGYRLIDKTFQTRRIQQTQGATMANLNNRAREMRMMLSDMLVILVFEKPA